MSFPLAMMQEYMQGYLKALILGKCINNLTRMMFIGPPFVGKSSIMKLFTGQQLDLNEPRTQIAHQSDRMTKINVYNIRNLKAGELYRVFGTSIKTSVESLMNDNDAQNINLCDQEMMKDDYQSFNPSSQMGMATSPNQDICNNNQQQSSTCNNSSQTLPDSGLNQKLYQDFIGSYLSSFSTDHFDNQFAKIWDFGGDTVYQVIHHPFISGNSIYILVFNIAQDINQKVVIRDGRILDMTYLQAIKEWLTLIIGNYNNQSEITATVKGTSAKYSLPIVILVASHGDCIRHEKEGIDRFNKFQDEIIHHMPSFRRNFYSSDIIFNCKPDDNNPLTQTQRMKCCYYLHCIIKQFVQSLPFMHKMVPIRWYTMAMLLHTSVMDDDSYQAVNASSKPLSSGKVDKIMTMQQIELLAKEYSLYNGNNDLKAMLMYLHDLGEIIFCQKAGDEGIIVTDVAWILCIFRAIIQLNHDTCPSGSLEIRSEYKMASQEGIISRNYIDYFLNKFNVDQEQKKSLIQLMEIYDIICPISNNGYDNSMNLVNNKIPRHQYLVPYLLQSDGKSFDLEGYHKSHWLYIGYENSDIPFIPNGIYYYLLSSCLKEWNNTKIQLNHQYAKYYLADDHHYIIFKKEESHIGLQYCYQRMEKPKSAHYIMNKVKLSIYTKLLHHIIKNMLLTIINKRLPKFNAIPCHFYIICNYCEKFTSIQDSYQSQDVNLTQCQHCNKHIEDHPSINDWMIYDEKLWTGKKRIITIVLSDSSEYHCV